MYHRAICYFYVKPFDIIFLGKHMIVVKVSIEVEEQNSFQEYSVNFQESTDAESCHKFCGINDDCEWWSWQPELSLCMLFANCTDSGHPDTALCPDCISGQRM